MSSGETTRATPSTAAELPPKAGRLLSIDVYRGLVMTLMLAEVLSFCAVAGARPGNLFWGILCSQQSHAAWVGCTLHDLIQPSFAFLVGVAMSFSLARRGQAGQTRGQMTRHAFLRSIGLIGLGLFLVSTHQRRPVWSFIDTLILIGLGYGPLFWLACRGARARWTAFGVILVVSWLAFALYPLPAADFDYEHVGVPAAWLREHGLSGFAAHWQKNSNVAWAFDVWFLNLFPQPEPFVGQPNGLCTLTFVPHLATMLLGLWAGDILRSTREDRAKTKTLVGAGLIGIVGGALLGGLGICPVVKAIWTPSWVLFSGGLCLLFLAGFHVWLDKPQTAPGHPTPTRRRLVYPLLIVGMNSIAAYALSHLFPAFAYNSVRRVTGRELFQICGEAYEPLLYGAVILVGYWIALFALYRGKIFLRV